MEGGAQKRGSGASLCREQSGGGASRQLLKLSTGQETASDGGRQLVRNQVSSSFAVKSESDSHTLCLFSGRKTFFWTMNPKRSIAISELAKVASCLRWRGLAS